MSGRSEQTLLHGALAAVSVLVAADDTAARRDLVEGLALTARVTVAGQAGDGESVVAAVALDAPDVVLMDVDIPGLDGVRAARRLSVLRPELPVMLRTGTPSDDLSMLALRAGAAGLVSTALGPEALARVLHAVARDEGAVPRRTARAMSEEVYRLRRRARDLRPIDSRLTTREWQVLHRMTAGVTTAEISRELFLSIHTVRSHIKRMLAKLEVHTRAEAIAWAEHLAEAGRAPWEATVDAAEEEHMLARELAALLQPLGAAQRR